MRVFAAVSSLLALGYLGGCGSVPGLAQAEGAALVVTDKTITDNIVSYYSGKNCSVLRTYDGLTYCEEDEIQPNPNIFCYRTLGEVTCYERPDPYDGRRRKVGENDHNYVKKY